MNIRLLCAFILLCASSVSASDDFNRELPGKDLSEQITSEKFPNMDAVIILKEQSYQIKNTDIFRGFYDLSGLSTGFNKVMIVKILNETGVKRYGTFEFTYREKFGNEIKNGFTVHARMLKPNGNVVVVDEDDITSMVVETNSNGAPMRRKVMFKYPDLQPGDIIQYEYQYADLFSYASSGLFYYSDHDYVLFSNLYITLPDGNDIRTISLPADKIGQPKISQVSNSFGAGETYFWSVRNLAGIPDEPMSRPFEDISYMTGFYVEGKHPAAEDNWNFIASILNEKIFEKGDIDKDDILKLGFQPKASGVTLATADSLYTSIRKYFSLYATNSLRPVIDDIDKTFTKKKADASDLSYIMYLILKGWGQSPNLVLLRDRREGTYDTEIPSLQWFDRLGLLVKIDGKERLYDFDRCLPTTYEYPWYLNPVNIAVLAGEKCYHKTVADTDAGAIATIREEHHLAFDGQMEVRDNMKLAYTGSRAQKERGELYTLEPSEVKKYFKDMTEGKCLLKADSISVNNFLDEKELCATISGPSNSKPEVIDSALTISFKNRVLAELREDLFTSARRTPISFDSPMRYLLSWEFPAPAGYHTVSDGKPQRLTGPAECSTELICTQTGDTVRFAATVTIPHLVIMADQYRSFMTFLDRSIAQVERTIALTKKTGMGGN